MRPKKEIFVDETATILDVLGRIERSGSDFALVTGGDGRLEAFITDGDIRHAIARGGSLADPISTAVRHRPPKTVPEGETRETILDMLVHHGIRHMPVLDEKGRVVEVVTIGEFLGPNDLDAEGVIFAGGEARRMRPLSLETPKPLLPVGGVPIIERILSTFAAGGVGRVTVILHHMADRMRAYFDERALKGNPPEVVCIEEETPRGTAGGLSLLRPAERTIIATNGDVLSDMDMGGLIRFHKASRSLITVATRPHRIEIPFGVLETDGDRITGVTEKPILSPSLNAGIYALEPEALDLIPEEGRFDFTSLISKAVAEEKKVTSYLFRGRWMDIGDIERYGLAQTVWRDL